MIDVQNLTFGYDKSPLLCEVSHRFEDGKITAIVGPNGAGKSTLLRLMARLLRPASGQIRVDGRADFTERQFAQTVAFLPQHRPVPELSVRTLVMAGRFARTGALGRPSRADEEAVDRAIARMHLPPDRAVSALSGGQQQKAYWAMLMAQDTKHLLLDEPFNHLDIAVQLELAQAMRQLRDEGKCIAVVMHDLARVPDWCDEAVVLHEGRIVYKGKDLFQSGAVEEVFGVRVIQKESIAFLLQT